MKVRQIGIRSRGPLGKEIEVRFMLRRAMGVLLLAAGFAAADPLPAPAQDSPRVPVEQATTRQKAVFVGKLVSRSISAKTIEDQGDAAAKASLGRARSLVEEAHADIAAARYEVANDKLDEALRLINTEARRLSEVEIKGKRLREAYDRRRNSVAIFLSAYERVAGEKELSPAAKARAAEIRKAVREAEKLAAAGSLNEANDILGRAYQAERGAIRELREGKTLVRTLNFETPEAEYRYEHDRNDSHVMLLKFAISEKNPPKTRRIRIDALREQAMGLRGEAESQAQIGDHTGAIETLARSTQTLLKAIRMSGIWMPG